MQSEMAIKCPKCNCQNFEVLEVFETHIYYKFIQGKFEGSWPEKQGNPTGYIAIECNLCKHHWIPRKKTRSIIIEFLSKE